MASFQKPKKLVALVVLVAFYLNATVLAEAQLLATLAPIQSPASALSQVYVDLRAWIPEGRVENGLWEVSADGLSVVQRLRRGPTYFASSDTYVNLLPRPIKAKPAFQPKQPLPRRPTSGES